MDRRIKGLLAACSLGVALLGTAPSWSAIDQEVALPPTELDELEQIVINGKRIEQRILESEQRLYERYNALNGNQDFDVDCSAKWNDGKSSGYGTAQYRSGCVPLFFANALAANLTHSRGWTTCRSSMRASTGWGSGMDSTLRTPSGGRSVTVSPPGFECVSDSSISSPAARLTWLERRDAFKANLNNVIRGDPELQALAREFNSLMRDNDDALKVSAAARKQQAELRRAARMCAAPTSPRASARACTAG
jgi:hypothetical protein